MASRRKQIEEEIERAKDPAIRMQLQMLSNKKGHGPSKRIKRVEEAFDSLLRRAITELPDPAPQVLLVVLVTIILLILYIILER